MKPRTAPSNAIFKWCVAACLRGSRFAFAGALLPLTGLLALDSVSESASTDVSGADDGDFGVAAPVSTTNEEKADEAAEAEDEAEA
jgi:hypothetical protein